MLRGRGTTRGFPRGCWDTDRSGWGGAQGGAGLGSHRVLLRWGCSAKPGPETGGPQRPNWQLPPSRPEPATAQRGYTEPRPSPPSLLRAKQKPGRPLRDLGLGSALPGSVPPSAQWGWQPPRRAEGSS